MPHLPTRPRARSPGRASSLAGANRRRPSGWRPCSRLGTCLATSATHISAATLVRAQLEQVALEQRRTVDRHEPRLDDNGIPDVELLWRLLYTGFDNQFGNPEDLVPEFAEFFYADMFGEGDDTGVEYDYTTYRSFYDTLLAALFMGTDEHIVDKYALASLEISETRCALAAERDYSYGRSDDDDDDDGGRYDCTADLVALGLW